METTGTANIPRARDRWAHVERQLAIERLRDSVIDLDVTVDDARVELDAAIERLRAAVRDRDAALRDLLTEIEAERVA